MPEAAFRGLLELQTDETDHKSPKHSKHVQQTDNGHILSAVSI